MARARMGAVPLGLGAGVAGSLVLSFSDAFEHAVLQRRPRYHPVEVGERLWVVWRGARAQPPDRFGLLLRWAYGPALGMLYGALRARLSDSTFASGMAFGCLIFAFEAVAMPAAGATVPLPLWPCSERWLLLVHTIVFGLAAAYAFDAACAHTDAFVRRRVGRTESAGAGSSVGGEPSTRGDPT